MEYLKSLLEIYNIPILSAFILGLMTAISPCPLATNITATAFISKNISSKRKVLLSGLLYAAGRGFSYTTIGLILYFGASKSISTGLKSSEGNTNISFCFIVKISFHPKSLLKSISTTGNF